MDFDETRLALSTILVRRRRIDQWPNNAVQAQTYNSHDQFNILYNTCRRVYRVLYKENEACSYSGVITGINFNIR